jgi:hypothetical protein
MAHQQRVAIPEVRLPRHRHGVGDIEPLPRRVRAEEQQMRTRAAVGIDQPKACPATQHTGRMRARGTASAHNRCDG